MMAHDIDEAIATYLTGLRVEGKADRTISTYAETLRDFRRVGRKLDLPDTVEAYEIEHVYAFLGDLLDRGAAPSYQHRRHREVRTFFSWCLKKMRWIERNPFAAVDLIRLQEKIVPPLSAEDIDRLLGLFDASKHTGCRNRALILYMLDTGVRVSECISVRLEDLDWEHGRQLVRNTKNKKERWVGFVAQTAEALRDYVDRFRGEEPGPLFLTSRTHAPMATGNTVRTILRRAAERAGLEGVHPHRFRHTFATWAIQSGAREIDVQMLLGHSSVTMVQRYSKTYTSEQAVLAHADMSPVAQLAAAVTRAWCSAIAACS